MKTDREVYQDGISMGIQTTRLMTTIASAGAGGRHARTGVLLLSILSLTLGSWPLQTARGQTSSKPSANRRVASKPSSKDADQQTTSAGAVTQEYSSPNADYAVNGVLSRTATETDQADADLSWSTGLTRRLWENRMAAPDPNEDADSRAALNDLIRRVRSLQFEDGDTTPAFSAPQEPTGPAEPAPLVRPPQRPQTNQTDPIPAPSRPAEPQTALTPTTQERLQDVLRDPNQVQDPLEMAELLFLSGRQTEAAVFYEKALALTAPNDPTTESDRAWILFQLGNCLRETDMNRARDMYIKLVSEYPSSPWTELAKAHGRLITWYQSARPQQFMLQEESQ